MKYNIKMTDNDYIEFNTFLVFNTKAGQSAILRGRLLGLAISVLVILIMVLAKADKWLLLVEIILLSIFSIVVFVTYPGSVKKMMRKRILKLKEDGQLAYVPESTLEFLDDEIFEIRPDGERHVPYSSIIRVDETGEYIYLRKGAQEAIVLPKRCLEPDAAKVSEFLKGKVATYVDGQNR